jgi:transposase
MKSTKKELKLAKRACILTLHREGYRTCDIARIVHIGASTVRAVVNRWGKDSVATNTMVCNDQKRSGRPRKFTERVERCLVKTSQHHPFWGAEKIAKACHTEMLTALLALPEGTIVQIPAKPSSSTVRRIWKRGDLECGQAARKPQLKPHHVAKVLWELGQVDSK